MDPILGGALVGGMNLMSSVFGTTQNNQNSQLMQQQAENYNTQMSNTAYQRASADMKAAGLNPMMMFGSGSAASSPTIQPAVKNSALSGIGPATQQGLQSAMAMRTANATVDNMVQENANLKTKRLLDEANTRVSDQVTDLTAQKGQNAAIEGAQMQQQLKVLMNKATQADNENALRSTPAGKLLDQFALGGRAASDVFSPISNIVSSAKNAGAFKDRWPDYNYNSIWRQ